MTAKYIQGDIHKVIKEIKDNSIDLIYTNPPYGTTNKKWDTPLDWKNLWIDIWRVVKPNGIVVLHAAKPFSYKLIQTQMPKYNYTWVKNNSTGFFNAKHQPLRQCEEIYVYYKNTPCTYNPQMKGTTKYKNTFSGKSNYYGNIDGKKKAPQGYHIGKYPTDLLEFKIKVRGGKTIPDEMIEYFIKTYSNEGETVLDMTTHNTVVGNVVKSLGRNFIGVDLLPISAATADSI